SVLTLLLVIVAATLPNSSCTSLDRKPSQSERVEAACTAERARLKAWIDREIVADILPGEAEHDGAMEVEVWKASDIPSVEAVAGEELDGVPIIVDAVPGNSADYSSFGFFSKREQDGNDAH
ncbi:MAG TPA: hypothetical protein VKV03_18435, partial [Candidatus Binataceae bacterium]|nr:hypothetical protein [Candidatus Binataceae bacterium]